MKVENNRFIFVDNLFGELYFKFRLYACIAFVEEYADVFLSQFFTTILSVFRIVSFALLILLTIKSPEELVYLLVLSIQLTFVVRLIHKLRLQGIG